MPAVDNACLRMSKQAREVAWRIFGAGASPLTGRSSYDLMRPLVEGYVAATHRQTVIREIQGWFESHGNRHWLRPEVKEEVAAAIIEEIETTGPPWTGVWAVGSIDAELAASLIRSNWSTSAIDDFVHATLDALKETCDRNQVLDVGRVFGPDFDSAKVKLNQNNFVQEGQLETFRELAIQDLRLVFGGLHPSVENLIDLSVALRPDLLSHLIKTQEHPVVQARAARLAIEAARLSNHRATLDWIRADACGAQVALAIVHSLETINALDDDRRFSDRKDMVGHRWGTELRSPCDNLDAAAEKLLDGLVESLSRLRPPDCIRWIGELLAVAPGILQTHGYEIPLRVRQLETECTKALERLVYQSWSSDLLEILYTGLRTASRETWTRHLGSLAWALRESAPKRAAEIARTALCDHDAYVMQALKHHDLPMEKWRYWEHRDWISSLGVCLAVANPTHDLRKWVVDQCRKLPLSVWDADVQEDHRTFITAERLAQRWFLLAFHAIQPCQELGRKIDSAVVLSLTRTFCDHCHYVQPYVHYDPASSVAAECAVRCAVEFGEANEGWLLDLARHPAAGARILWTVADQGSQKLERIGDGEVEPRLHEIFVIDLASIASNRFGDGRRHGLDDLEYWGRLWLLLGKAHEAEETALVLLKFPARSRSRAHTILALKLLALAAGKRSLDPPIRDRFQSLYREFWSVFTPNEEQLDREHVDALLKGSPHGLLSIRSTH